MVIDLNNAPPQQDGSSPRSFVGEVKAEDIRTRLNEDVRGFLLWLYSGRAFMFRTEARIGNIMGEAGTSRCIELSGKNVGKWYDLSLIHI